MTIKQVLVVGAGIGGLTAAFRLQQAGFQVVVLEKLPYIGGRTRSVVKAGCVIDTGATVLPSSYRQTFELITELGLLGQLDTVGGSFAVPRDGRMHCLSIDHPLRALLTTPLLNWKSKLMAGKLLFKLLPLLRRFSFTSLGPLQPYDQETLAQYCQRELPGEVYDYLLNPMLKFLYIHNGQSGSLVELLWWLSAMGLGPSRSFRGGMSTLAEGLAKSLDVRLSEAVCSIVRQEGGVVVTSIDAQGQHQESRVDYCLVSTPGPIAAEVAGAALAAQQQAFLAARVYQPCIVVCFCTRRRPALEVLMVEVPDEVSEDLATLVFQHNVARGRAPAGQGIVNAYFTGPWSQRRFEADDRAITAAAQAVVRPLVPEVDEVLDVHIQRWPYNAALSEVGACAKIADFQATAKPTDRIRYIGDYLVQASVNVAVATANEAARQIIQDSGDAEAKP